MPVVVMVDRFCTWAGSALVTVGGHAYCGLKLVIFDASLQFI